MKTNAWLGTWIVGTLGLLFVAAFTRGDSFPPIVDLKSLDGANGFVLRGSAEGDLFGISVSGAGDWNADGFALHGVREQDQAGSRVAGGGDVNGDGVADILIAAFAAAPGGNSRAGECYVVFGRTTGFPASIELASLDGTNGFTLVGGDESDLAGVSIAIGGDLDGRGRVDRCGLRRARAHDMHGRNDARHDW